jgi:hypothetical protein
MPTINSITFGSRPLILFIRIGQLLFPLFAFALMVGERSVLPWLIMLIALLLWEGFMFSMVFATLNQDGLPYQRWKLCQQVNWAEMTYGGSAPIGFVRIKLVRKPIWNRYLLLRNPVPQLEDQEYSLPGAVRFYEILQPPSGRTN